MLLSEAPLVEGAVAAAARARGGASLEEVAAEARGALAHEGLAARRRADAAAPPRPTADAAPADAELRLEVRNAIGLHARPAARFVGAVRGFDAERAGGQRDAAAAAGRRDAA